MSEIRFIDLFSGIGGFRRGLELSEGYRCVWSNDWNKYANQIYTSRFGEEGHHSGDIRKVRASSIPDHDLLCAGFPCQAFSVAGKRRGFEDTRGTLFFEIARITRAKRPTLLLLENVKGLLSHNEGQTYATILEVLGDLGYWAEWQVLNSKWFGVPQNRERVFIIGHLRGRSTRLVFPITETNSLSIEELGERGGVASCLDSNYHKGARRQRTFVVDPFNKAERQDMMAGAIKTNQRSSTSTGTAVVEPFIKNIPHGYNDGFEKPLPSLKSNRGAQYNELLVQPLRFLNRNQKNFGNEAMTVDPTNSTGIRQGARIRRLTPVECERLQGFPDGWTEGISDTQRYKCLGNAVTVNVIKFLGDRIRESINSKSNRTP